MGFIGGSKPNPITYRSGDQLSYSFTSSLSSLSTIPHFTILITTPLYTTPPPQKNYLTRTKGKEESKMADILTQLQTCLDQVHSSPIPSPPKIPLPHHQTKPQTHQQLATQFYATLCYLTTYHDNIPATPPPNKHDTQRRASTGKNPQERIHTPGPSLGTTSSTIAIASVATTTRHNKQSPSSRAECRPTTTTEPRWDGSGGGTTSTCAGQPGDFCGTTEGAGAGFGHQGAAD